MLRQIPLHPVRQVGFVREMIIHGDRSQHDRPKTARHFRQGHADNQQGRGRT
ncbi:hypothetical protein SFR_5012 [Streptomyces sp. FR-008]|nr:hypothetical protein SFR_5012 [Streptomyces sp. FR-008]